MKIPKRSKKEADWEEQEENADWRKSLNNSTVSPLSVIEGVNGESGDGQNIYIQLRPMHSGLKLYEIDTFIS